MIVTVVIPARNAAATLPAQLAALAAQALGQAFRVIVVDNGSSDGTGDLARAFASDRFTVAVVEELTVGINSARNAGVKAAGSGVVLLCDADDEVSAGWVAAMVSAIRPNSWVAGRLDYQRLNSAATKRLWNAADRSVLPPPARYIDVTFGCNCGFWFDMWSDLGGFDPRISGSGGDEAEFFRRAASVGYEPRIVTEAVVSYRLRPGWRAMMHQRARQGRNQILLRELPGGSDLQPISRRMVAVAAIRLAVASPKYLLRSRRRGQWAGAVAMQWGRWTALTGRRP